MTANRDDTQIVDRRAQLVISRQALTHMLRLPEGTRITWIQTENDPMSFRIGVVHEALPVVDPDIESPVIWPTKIGREMRMIDGEIWERSVAWFDVSKAAQA